MNSGEGHYSRIDFHGLVARRLPHHRPEWELENSSGSTLPVTEIVGRRAERHHGLCRLGRSSKTKDNGKLIAKDGKRG